MGEEITLTYKNNNGMKSKTGKLFTIDGNVVKLKYPDRGSEMEVNLLNVTNIKTRALISGSLRKKMDSYISFYGIVGCVWASIYIIT